MSIIEENPDGSGEYTLGPGGAISLTKWATVADVASVTGETVTELQRTIAAGVIELLCGLIESVERADISDRDRYFLRQATCYQAAFVKDNPDLFMRADVTSASQDGESAAFRNADAHLLSPLARKALRRLSWRGLARPGDRLPLRAPLNVNSEEFDDSLAWKRV